MSWTLSGGTWFQWPCRTRSGCVWPRPCREPWIRRGAAGVRVEHWKGRGWDVRGWDVVEGGGFSRKGVGKIAKLTVVETLAPLQYSENNISHV